MVTQQYNNGKTVLDAAKERISYIFDNFQNIIVSISGGKDSTVMVHLALLEAAKRGRKIGIFCLDEEVMYQSSIDQVNYLMELFPDNIEKYWLQIEFNLTNATSFTDSQLKCWEHGKHKEWMRSKRNDAIHTRMWDLDTQTVRDKNKGFGFYDAIENFERIHHNTAFLVGLRAAGESPNRWRAMVKNPVEVNGKKVYWATKKGNGSCSMYPIYDWNFHDVWRYIAENNIKYSKVYDWQFKKGFSFSEMRVSSLIHERSFKSLCELPEFEPKTYEKLCKRIKGIQFAQETGRDSRMFKARKLPQNFKSWMAYRDFLLQTYPDPSKKHLFEKRYSKHLNNEFVARQQCRQLILNDYENNIPIENKLDPREELLNYYKNVL